LRYIEEHDLVGNARARGDRLQRLLNGIRERHPIVGDVRGLGLLVGLELVADPDTRQPFPVERRVAHRIAEIALEAGLITYPLQGCVDGVEGDMIKLTPPLCVTDAQIDEIVVMLEAAIAAVEHSPGARSP
jgi:adenosylmethionine-8-amino-7-oxononanoate aminotransferase